MSLFFLIFGTITGLIFWAIEYFILGYFGFHEIKETKPSLWIAIVVLMISGFCTLIVLAECGLDGKPINPWFLSGTILGIILSVLYLLWKILRPEGRYLIILKKIEKLNDNICKLNCNYSKTDKQKAAEDILLKAKQKLKEQSYDILILDSIRIAKNIERSHTKIDIQRELDELEALQYLNR